MADDTFLIDDDDRYASLRLIGWWEQDKLLAARVMVVGAGALGNEVLKNLALLGIGTVYIIDFDQVESSNLARSVLFRPSDRGRPKAEVAAATLSGMNPAVRVKPFHANVLTDVGLGLFRDVDVVIGCLDNREARLWVNRCCWKTGTPWIDGGIQEINGVVKVFTPPDSACYECVMTETDYRLINLRYSCPLLRQEDIVSGKVPTAPTIASIIGGMQTQEALKLIHGMPASSGEAIVYNGVANQFYRTKFPFRDDCMSHDSYPEPVALPLSHRSTAKELFAAVRSHFGDPSIALQLDRDLVKSVRCGRCGRSTAIMQPLPLVGMKQAVCPDCGETAAPEISHVIEPDGEFADEPLSRLGVPPYDIVRITSEQEERTYLLADDRESVMEVETMTES